jgi:hypothetical protein
MAKPNNVGHPSLLAILPTILDSNEFMNLNVNGLNINNTINVVYRVYFHLLKEAK